MTARLRRIRDDRSIVLGVLSAPHFLDSWDTHREPASGIYYSVVMHSPGSLLDLGIPTHNHVPTGRG